MTPSENARKLIADFEGCRLTAYLCPAGVPTIGYGATGPDVRLGLTWTLAQANARFVVDLARFGGSVDRLLEAAPTTQGQFDALVSFAYNLGIGALGKSTLLKDHKAGLYAAAKGQFALWNRSGGTVLPGLVKRRAAEAALYAGARDLGHVMQQINGGS
jgi:lysozyme